MVQVFASRNCSRQNLSFIAKTKPESKPQRNPDVRHKNVT